MTRYLTRFAFSDRKNSRKSRGSGIIRVGTLTEQFEAFKPFLDGLTTPKSHFGSAVVQIGDDQFRSVNAS